LWFYYTGIKYRAFPKDADKEAGAVCLAVLRRDGFVSLDARKKEGQLITRPFVLRNKEILVNVNIRNGGRVLVEASDKAGKVIATSKEIRGDHRRTEVRWAKGNIAILKGKVVKLKFTLREAELYSFWVG